MAVVTSLNSMSLTFLQKESSFEVVFYVTHASQFVSPKPHCICDFLQIVPTGFVFNRGISMGEYETLLYFKVCANYTHTL